MNIGIYSIQKSKDLDIEIMLKHYQKLISKYSNIKDIVLFNKSILAAQNAGEKQARESYGTIYNPYLSTGYNIALDENGLDLDSFEFSKIFENNSNINFYIGGAYGFSKSFLTKVDKVISLSSLTFAHKIAKLVLYEQVYRGLCIKNFHPYHK